MNHSIEFFSHQFEAQIERGDYALNPFEVRALPYLSGRVIDLGCGLGNLSVTAAREGMSVSAFDASPQAVADLRKRAAQAGLDVHVDVAELSGWRAEGQYDSVVCIGLLMFFPCEQARGVISELRRATRPGGVLVVNVLVEGTTFMSMFERDAYCLFPADELRAMFSGWSVLEDVVEDFPAGEHELKRFLTLVVRAPANG